MSNQPNTSRVQQRGQSITWTLNNYTTADVDALKRDWPTYAKYLCFGKETALSGTPHLQGYMSLHKQTAYSTIHTYPGLERAYFVNSRGNCHDNRNYCSKGELSHEEYIRYRKGGDRFGQDVRSHPDFGRNADFWESGPLADAIHQGKANNLVSFLEELGSGKRVKDVVAEDPVQQATYVRNYRGIDRINDLLTRGRSAVDGFPEIHWISGITGQHKTRAFVEFSRRYVGVDATVADDEICAIIGAPEPGSSRIWFDEFKHQPVAVLDDLRASTHPFVWLLGILDRYGRSVDIKGGRRKWNPEVIFVTTPKSPRGTYFGQSDERLDQLTRRINESGGKVWHFPDDREDFYKRLDRLLPRGTESWLSDPRRHPTYRDELPADVPLHDINDGGDINVLPPSVPVDLFDADLSEWSAIEPEDEDLHQSSAD